jgi:hypothetical protein
VVVPGTVSFDSVTATFTPSDRLDLLATYTVTVTQSITDLAGTPLQSEFTSSFTVRDGVWREQFPLTNDWGGISYQFYPEPAIDGHGNALVVWGQSLENGSGEEHVWSRMYSPQTGWGDALQVDYLAGACSSPSVAMNEAGDALVAWRQTDGSYQRIMARRYIAGSWETNAVRVDSGDNTGYGNVVAGVSPTGDFHVLWTYYSTYYYVYGRHAIVDGPWGGSVDMPADQYITGSFTSISPPRMAFDPTGNGFAVWVSQSAMVNTVQARRYLTSTENWDVSDPIMNSDGAQIGNFAPRVLADANGGAMATWPKSPDVMATRFTKAGGWTAAAAIDTGDGSLDSEAATPGLGYGAGEFGALWLQAVGDITNTYGSIYTTEWGEPGLASDGDNTAYYFSGLGFGMDRHGNALALWIQQSTDFGVSDVMFNRLVHGATAWNTPDLANLTAGQYMEAALAVSPNGMAVGIWSTGYPYENHEVIYGAMFE